MKRRDFLSVSLPGLATLALLVHGRSAQAVALSLPWSPTGNMTTARVYHTAILLPNGKILVAGGGGNNGNALSSAELYDPTSRPSGSWSSTGPMSSPRQSHTATLFPNGKVLVAGGENGNGNARSSAELYDPTNGPSGSWSSTGPMSSPRAYHTATLLPNGKVLVAGGFNFNDGSLSSAELYDPTSGTWLSAGNMSSSRDFHTATLLPNGKVLVAGGENGGGSLSSAELYDPTSGPSGSWSFTGSMTTSRQSHTATLLPNGKVLVAGGHNNGNARSSAELYDPTSGPSGSWSSTGPMSTPRAYHTATLLLNGKVLVAGGNYNGNTLSSPELYNPASNTWLSTGNMSSPRQSHTATLLASPYGKVLVAGGGYFSILATAELYDRSGNVL